MTERQGISGPQFHADRPVEQEAVRTTIVGGRPPGSGKSVGQIPRGIEILVKKASIDPDFRQLLLAKRAEAADKIGLRLDPAEAMMLAAVPRAQLEAIIARTTVPQEHRRAFLGKAAAAVLAPVALTVAGCPKGCAPDRPLEIEPPREKTAEKTAEKTERPSRPPIATEGGSRPGPGDGPPARSEETKREK